jgi:peptidoglycan/xylan/chitin deacetylase (PgdA/CDA1 family)
MRRALLAALLGLAAGCSSLPEPGAPAQPIRFLLTFDDGPATWSLLDKPSTVRVLETLADNPVQRGIKAVFFVQTRAWNAGGSEAGRGLLRREHEEGHLLAVHTGTRGSHESHVHLADEALEQSLADAKADIAAITGEVPRLVRPPFWAYDERTLAAYGDAGLAMLLTDLSARDGVVWGVNFSLRKRSNLAAQLAELKQRLAGGRLPVLDGAVPVVATFHDVNSHTARNLAEYLRILVEEARAQGLEVADKPFYDERAELARAALLRAFETPRLRRDASYNPRVLHPPATR